MPMLLQGMFLPLHFLLLNKLGFPAPFDILLKIGQLKKQQPFLVFTDWAVTVKSLLISRICSEPWDQLKEKANS